MAEVPGGRWFGQSLIVLASLLAGLAVWTAVQLNERDEITLEVELVARDVDPRVNLEILRNRVAVRFSYPATEVAKMKADSFLVAVEFPDIIERIGAGKEESGERVVTPDMVQARPGTGIDMSAQSVVATEVLVNQVDWRATLRTMPATIKPKIVGTPRKGYEFDSARVDVENAEDLFVLLTKKKQTELKDAGTEIYVIETEPLSIEGKSGTIREPVMLDMEEGVTLAPGEPDEWFVSVTLVEALETRRLEKVPVRYELFSARDDIRAVLRPEEVDVLVTGPSSAVARVVPGMIAFALYGVVEEAGETRIVALEARLNDPELSKLIPSSNVETEPKSIEVRIESTAEPEIPVPTPSPTPTATPEPTPTPTPTPEPAPEPKPTLATDDASTT